MQTKGNMRSVLLVVLALSALGVSAAAAQSARTSAAPPQRCGFLRASVPYSHHGNRDRWRVYARGPVTCATARHVLNDVLHLNAHAHVGQSQATSYFSVGSWTCDFGQMGEQACWRPHRQPFAAGFLARNCDDHADGGCPADIPADYVP
jgi:hypothetical protein